MDIAERQRAFQRSVTVDEAGCWIRPTARRNPTGHDTYYRDVWRLFYGPTPKAPFQIDHTCGRGNRGCVNPYHLKSRTASTNTFLMRVRQRRQMSRKHLQVARYLHNAVVNGGVPTPKPRRHV